MIYSYPNCIWIESGLMPMSDCNRRSSFNTWYTLSGGVSSVIEMVKKLDRKGFVVYRKYDGVTLTERGREIASIIKDRHDTIKAFLKIISVPEQIAERDACTMEHELDSITTKQIKNLVNFV